MLGTDSMHPSSGKTVSLLSTGARAPAWVVQAYGYV